MLNVEDYRFERLNGKYLYYYKLYLKFQTESTSTNYGNSIENFFGILIELFLGKMSK